MLRILLVHDLVEIYAGDAAIYDDEATKGQKGREEDAACKLFQQLPPDQGASLAALWREFEDLSSAEARFARAIDALAPTWLHWGQHADPTPEILTTTRIMERKTPVLAPYPALYELLEGIVQSAMHRGLVAP